MSDQNLRLELESLLTSPGWLWLTREVTEHWQSRLDAVLVQATSPTDPGEAIKRVQQVLFAREAVKNLLAMPETELSKLARNEPREPTYARRGPL